jgi:GTP-binding protein Era
MSISQTVYVHKQSQKAIVIGKGGSMITRIVKDAAIDMKELFEKPVQISIFVKVKEDWMSRL